MKKYVVYITQYKGVLLPQWYIGSSSEEKVKKGYNGTVLSKKWKEIYNYEQKENKNLFRTKILSYHYTREEALQEELRLQKKHEVIKNKKYFNESYASINGMFGRDVSGELNPMYKKTHSKSSIIKKKNTENKINKETGKTLKEESEIKRQNTAIKKFGNTFGNIKKGIETKSKEFITENGEVTTINKETGKKQSITKNSKEWKETKGIISSKNMRNNHTDVSGSNNPRALKIEIYDSNCELIYICNGNLKKYCEKNNFPYSTFRKSYIENKRMYSDCNKSALTKLKNNGKIKFLDWYCIKI